MTRLIVTTLAIALLAGSASAQIGRQGDRLVDLSKEPVQRTVTDGTEVTSADREAILQTVAGVLGQDAIRSNGMNLPDEVEDAIVEGDPLPEGANPRPIKDELAVLLSPYRPDGTAWVQAGEHLIATTPDGVAVMVLYDALN